MSEEQIKDNEKYVAVASYITPAGWIVAYMFKWVFDIKTHYCIFHLRQGLGQTIVFGILWVLLSNADIYLANEIAKLCYVILQIIGIISALNLKCRYLPFLGKLYNKCITIIK